MHWGKCSIWEGTGQIPKLWHHFRKNESDDKAIKVSFGESSCSIDSGVRPHGKILAPITADGSVHLGSLAPSVNLFQDIPSHIDKSWVTRDVAVILNDSIFSPGNHFQHMAQLAMQILNQACNEADAKGGTWKVKFWDVCLLSWFYPLMVVGITKIQVSVQNQAAQLSFLLLLDLYVHICNRNALDGSWVNSVERIMSLLNLRLQRIAYRDMCATAKVEKMVHQCNRMPLLHEKAIDVPEIINEWTIWIQKVIADTSTRLGWLSGLEVRCSPSSHLSSPSGIPCGWTQQVLFSTLLVRAVGCRRQAVLSTIHRIDVRENDKLWGAQFKGRNVVVHSSCDTDDITLLKELLIKKCLEYSDKWRMKSETKSELRNMPIFMSNCSWMAVIKSKEVRGDLRRSSDLLCFVEHQMPVTWKMLRADFHFLSFSKVWHLQCTVNIQPNERCMPSPTYNWVPPGTKVICPSKLDLGGNRYGRNTLNFFWLLTWHNYLTYIPSTEVLAGIHVH